ALASIISRDFVVVRRQHDTTSIANRGVLRLVGPLEDVHPATVKDFFGLAALKIRQVLLDLVKPKPIDGVELLFEPADRSSADPVTLAICKEQFANFLEAVARLPEKEEREVIDICWCNGKTQAEAAVLLGIHPKEVSRRWIRAIRKLPRIDPDCWKIVQRE